MDLQPVSCQRQQAVPEVVLGIGSCETNCITIIPTERGALCEGLSEVLSLSAASTNELALSANTVDTTATVVVKPDFPLTGYPGTTPGGDIVTI